MLCFRARLVVVVSVWGVPTLTVFSEVVDRWKAAWERYVSLHLTPEEASAAHRQPLWRRPLLIIGVTKLLAAGLGSAGATGTAGQLLSPGAGPNDGNGATQAAASQPHWQPEDPDCFKGGVQVPVAGPTGNLKDRVRET
jgi:hypothetical protein